MKLEILNLVWYRSPSISVALLGLDVRFASRLPAESCHLVRTHGLQADGGEHRWGFEDRLRSREAAAQSTGLLELPFQAAPWPLDVQWTTICRFGKIYCAARLARNFSEWMRFFPDFPSVFQTLKNNKTILR